MEEKTFDGDQGVTGYVLDIPAEILTAARHNEWIAISVNVFDHGIIIDAAESAPDLGVDRFQTTATISDRRSIGTRRRKTGGQ